VIFSARDASAALASWLATSAPAGLDPRTPCVVATTGLGQAADLDAWREAAVDLVAALL
jgi:hypothetical protein